VPQEALEHHPELNIGAPQVTLDTFSDSEEELALMNIPKENIIPTFLTVAAKETEPFEPKTLHQAKNDTSWLEWERAMLEEVRSLHQNKTWELVDPPKDRRILSGKWVFKLKRGPHDEYKCFVNKGPNSSAAAGILYEVRRSVGCGARLGITL
jgi:hypothetical protein